mgnify:FL=1
MTLGGYTSIPFSETEIADDILVLTMDEAQKHKVFAEYEEAVSIYTLNEFVGEDEPLLNPYGMPLNIYGLCYENISMLMDKLTKKLNSYTEGEG